MTDITETTPPPETKPQPQRPNPWRHSFTVGCISLGLVPVFVMLVKIFATGGNVLSNDYLDWTTLIGKMLDGDYNWHNVIKDTFIGAHSMLLPVLVFFADAHFFAWNVRADLLVGLIFTFARSILLFDTLTRSQDGKVRWILFPVIMALDFGASQASVLLFGDTSVATGLALLGFTIALWGVCKSQRFGPIVLIIGGLISSYSWGNTVPCWLTLLLALILQRSKDVKSYLALFVGCALTALPYVLRFKANVSAIGSENTNVISLLNLPFIFNLVGRPFSPYIGTNFGWSSRSIVASAIALALIFGIASCYKRADSTLRKKAIPSLLVLCYGVASIWFISVFRTFIMPWYTPMACMVWIGLIGLAYCTISENDLDLKARIRTVPNTDNISDILRGSFHNYLVFTLVLFIGSVMFLCSNLRYDDKNCFLRTTTPASEAILRNYDTAPTYCEDTLFQWGGGAFSRDMNLLGQPLRKHMLSAFAPQETWSIQGEFAVGNVRVTDYPSANGVEFVRDRQATHNASWSSIDHLNLLVAPKHSVQWDLVIPSATQSARLVSAVANAKDSKASGAKAQIRIVSAEDNKELLEQTVDVGDDWRPIDVSLLPCKGKAICLNLSSVEGQDAGPIVWQYPVADFTIARDMSTREDLPLRPRNTELYRSIPVPAKADFSFAGFLDKSWAITGLHAENESGKQVTTFDTVTPAASIATTTPLNIDLSQFSQLFVEASASDQYGLRALYCTVRFSDQSVRGFCISLLPDAGLHQYTYDLKLLESPGNSVMTAMTISPRMTQKSSNPANFSLGGLRLISK